jgi:hypothetical protein
MHWLMAKGSEEEGAPNVLTTHPLALKAVRSCISTDKVFLFLAAKYAKV